MVGRWGEVSTKESVHGTMRFPDWNERFQNGTPARMPQFFPFVGAIETIGRRNFFVIFEVV
jgi:hypothetical protein